MSLAHILAAYINLNVLVIAGFVSLGLYPVLAGFAKRTIGSGALLKMHYAVLSITAASPQWRYKMGLFFMVFKIDMHFESLYLSLAPADIRTPGICL